MYRCEVFTEPLAIFDKYWGYTCVHCHIGHRLRGIGLEEPYPTLFEYPHQIPTHHTVANLVDTAQQELQQRIEAKAKQEQEKKVKAKKKCKQVTETIELEQSENIQIPSQTATIPGGNRGRNGANGDDGDRQGDRNHYWSLRDIPKFEGKGEQPFSHLMEFEDYLVAPGVTVEEDENDPRVQPDYRDYSIIDYSSFRGKYRTKGGKT